MNEVKVAITGAAGQIGYALLFRLASGAVFGEKTKVHLQLLELERALPALEGVKMELDDCAFPLLASVTCTADPRVAFKDVDWALLVGSVPRKQGMERADLLKINGGIFIDQGKALAEVGHANTKVLVVGNPCNTNSWIAKKAASGKIPEKNFFAMTMLDQNRALSQLATKSETEVAQIKNLAIWGNHSPTMYPDFYHAQIGSQKLNEVLSNEAWLQGDFLKTVQQRGSAIIKARGASSAASAANAVCDTVRALTFPTAEGEFFSVAVSSDGSYDVPEGTMFSYPIRFDGKEWSIVQGLEHGDFSLEKIKQTTEELVSEVKTVESLL